MDKDNGKMPHIKPIGAWLARTTRQRSQLYRLERAGPDLPEQVTGVYLLLTAPPPRSRVR
jgi:hypothetical protein